MSTLSNRLQVLVDDSRMDRLGRAADDAGISVGEFVRRAIDDALDDISRRDKQRDFLKFLDSVEPIDFGGPDGALDAIQEAKARPIFDDEKSSVDAARRT